MPSPYNDLNSKLELAAKSLVDALGLLSVTVNSGISIDELETPYVVVSSESGSGEAIKETGIVTLSLNVEVASSADDENSIAAHRARVAEVFDVFFNSTIKASLTAAIEDFHVYDVELGASSNSVEDRKHMTSLEMEVICCGADLTE